MAEKQSVPYVCSAAHLSDDHSAIKARLSTNFHMTNWKYYTNIPHSLVFVPVK